MPITLFAHANHHHQPYKTPVAPIVDALHRRRHSTLQHRTSEPTASAIDAVAKQRCESFPTSTTSAPIASCGRNQRAIGNAAPSPELSTPNCPYTGAVSKLLADSVVSTVSLDSGINMSFCGDPLPAERSGSHRSNNSSISSNGSGCESSMLIDGACGGSGEFDADAMALLQTEHR